MNLKLKIADTQNEPFPYALYSSVFSERANADLLDWLEQTDDWVLATTDFYEQYEFCVDDVALPLSAGFLKEESVRERLRNEVSSLFQLTLSPDVRLLAHKLAPRQHIGIHNDVIAGREACRLTVQLNRGLTNDDGGFFMLFNSSDPSDIHRFLKPVNNSAIAFAISERSNHAVSVQQAGIRYTLVFCFYECPN